MKKFSIYIFRKLILIMIIFMFVMLLSSCSNSQKNDCNEKGC